MWNHLPAVWHNKADSDIVAMDLACYFDLNF
jgi:hypothetical protein